MPLAADRAAGDDMIAADTQKRFQLAIDPDIDISPGARAGKV
jgi:hypothetical protein